MDNGELKYIDIEINGKVLNTLGSEYQTFLPIKIYPKNEAKEFQPPICTLYYSPNGNCQTFSISHIDSLIIYLINNVEHEKDREKFLKEILEVCKDKKQFIVDLFISSPYTPPSAISRKEIISYLSKFAEIINSFEYKSTNESNMALYLFVKKRESGIKLEELVHRVGRIY